jgi:hypothetical protein
MRVLRILPLGFGLIVGLPLGGFLLYWTLELNAVAQKAQATPQRLSVAQLAEKGVPDNLYVELTDCTFGKPVIEKNDKGWVGAWLLVEPTPQPKKAAKYVIFFRANVHDQAELDEFLKQSPGEALVASGLLKTSPWRVEVGPALRKAYPKLNFSHVLFLAEPQLPIFGHHVHLSDARLHDPRYESMGAWGGAGLILLALVSLYLMMKRRRTEGDGGFDASGLDADALRVQLASERPESVHSARAWGVLQRVIGFGILAGIMMLLVVVLTFGAVLSQSEGRPLGAVIFVLFDFPVFLGARAAIRAFLRTLRWPTDIAVCPTGLRWREGRKDRNILWAEVAEVHRDVKIIQRYRGTGLVGALNQLNNPAPPLIKDTLHITLHSGEFYLMSPQMVTDYVKFAETAARMWKEEAMRRDTAGITNAWLKSLPSRQRQNL